MDDVDFSALERPLVQVGTMLDGPGANRGRTARAHLLWVAQSSAIDASRIEEVVALAGLADVARRWIGSFSLGMGQRLGIAAALLGDPGVLVQDEPTNGLDPEGLRWMRRFLRSLAGEGRTVLVSSHLMSEMEETADDFVVIAKGRVIASGSRAEVTGAYASLEEAFFALTGDEGGDRAPAPDGSRTTRGGATPDDRAGPLGGDEAPHRQADVDPRGGDRGRHTSHGVDQRRQCRRRATRQ